MAGKNDLTPQKLHSWEPVTFDFTVFKLLLVIRLAFLNEARTCDVKQATYTAPITSLGARQIPTEYSL